MKRKRGLPYEATTRRQEGFLVTLFLWKTWHLWIISPLRPNGQPDITNQFRVEVDRPMDQQELTRWLAKTQPIEE